MVPKWLTPQTIQQVLAAYDAKLQQAEQDGNRNLAEKIKARRRELEEARDGNTSKL